MTALNRHCSQLFMRATNLFEVFHFYNKVSDLLTPLLKSEANGELSHDHQASLHFRCSAVMLSKVF